MARYERIAAEIRQMINAGAIEQGARLPAETALAVQYKVGRPTLRQAMDLLQDEGLIEKRHGSGTFVLGRRRQIEFANDRYWSLTVPEQAPAAHEPRITDPAVRVSVSCSEAAANVQLAARLGVPVGARLLEFVYRAHGAEDSSLYSVVHSYLVRSMVEDITMAPTAGRSPWGDACHAWLREAGIQVDRIEERVSARPPSDAEAQEFDLAPEVSLLVAQRKSIGVRGQVVEVADLTMAGDRVMGVYTTQLSGAHQQQL